MGEKFGTISFRRGRKLALSSSFSFWAVLTFCRLVFFVQRVVCVSVSDYVLRVIWVEKVLIDLRGKNFSGEPTIFFREVSNFR